MSAEKKQRGSRFTQAMSDALVESYAKYQVSKMLYSWLKKKYAITSFCLLCTYQCLQAPGWHRVQGVGYPWEIEFDFQKKKNNSSGWDVIQ